MENSWIEISLIVDGEIAESVAEVLSRYLPDGVVIESTAVTANPDDSEGRTVGPLRVAGYIPVDEKTEETRRQIEESLWYLGRIRPLPAPEFKEVRQTDWSEAWKQHYHPIPIGKRLAIVPAWMESPFPKRTILRIDPGMAFGTGTHPTTQLCLEFIETLFARENPYGFEWQDADVIDLGCGSGILGIAALILGARRALGVDIDAEAMPASLENAEANGVASRLELGLGSVSEIREGKYSIQKAQLVLANILAPVLVRLLDEGLGELVRPGGYLALSGILQEQSAEVEVALRRNRLELVKTRQMMDWVALLAQPNSTN
jgi:ribosomal protein L11 methyltransferase